MQAPIENSSTPSVYVLKVSLQMGQNNYYAIDLKGSLSRNVQDSMIFGSVNFLVGNGFVNSFLNTYHNQINSNMQVSQVA